MGGETLRAGTTVGAHLAGCIAPPDALLSSTRLERNKAARRNREDWWGFNGPRVGLQLCLRIATRANCWRSPHPAGPACGAALAISSLILDFGAGSSTGTRA